jgi:hypothetical protein
MKIRSILYEYDFNRSITIRNFSHYLCGIQSIIDAYNSLILFLALLPLISLNGLALLYIYKDMPIDIDEVPNVFSRNKHPLDFSPKAFFELLVLKTKKFMFLNVFENSHKATMSLIFMIIFTLSQCH